MLVEHLSQKWIPEADDFEAINDQDRLNVLKSLIQIDYSSKRLIGMTANLILEGKYDHFDSVSHYLQCMALLKYEPEIQDNDDANLK